MRGIIFLLMLLVLGFQSIKAQIITTSSNSGISSKQIVSSQQNRDGGEKFWFMKLGCNLSGLEQDNGDSYEYEDIDRSLGYNLEFGFNKQIARTPIFYKFNFGACSNLSGSYIDKNSNFKDNLKEFDPDDLHHAVYISPLNFGVKVNFGISLEASVGAFYMFEYTPDFQHDFGANLEAGLWLSKFYIGVLVQRGLAERDSDVPDNSYLSNVALRLGFSF